VNGYKFSLVLQLEEYSWRLLSELQTKDLVV
jgi:hypothetical protein